MKKENLCDGFDISVADDVEYLIAYHKKNTNCTGIATKVNGSEYISLTVSMVESILKEMRNPVIQATFFSILFNTIKQENLLNPLVDVAVSYKGKVLRTEDCFASNKEAADYSQ